MPEEELLRLSKIGLSVLLFWSFALRGVFAYKTPQTDDELLAQPAGLSANTIDFTLGWFRPVRCFRFDGGFSMGFVVAFSKQTHSLTGATPFKTFAQKFEELYGIPLE